MLLTLSLLSTHFPIEKHFDYLLIFVQLFSPCFQVNVSGGQILAPTLSSVAASQQQRLIVPGMLINYHFPFHVFIFIYLSFIFMDLCLSPYLAALFSCFCGIVVKSFVCFIMFLAHRLCIFAICIFNYQQVKNCNLLQMMHDCMSGKFFLFQAKLLNNIFWYLQVIYKKLNLIFPLSCNSFVSDVYYTRTFYTFESCGKPRSVSCSSYSASCWVCIHFQLS